MEKFKKRGFAFLFSITEEKKGRKEIGGEKRL